MNTDKDKDRLERLQRLYRLADTPLRRQELRGRIESLSRKIAMAEYYAKAAPVRQAMEGAY